MANQKRDVELVRVNFNLPKPIVEQVKEYSSELGISLAATYTFIIKNGLDQKEAMKQLPDLIEAFKEAVKLQDEEKKSEIE